MGKYKISLDRPESPQGELYEVPPVGLIENQGFAVADIEDDVATALGEAYGVTVTTSGQPVTELNYKYPGYDYPEEAPVVTPEAVVEEVVAEEGGETS